MRILILILLLNTTNIFSQNLKSLNNDWLKKDRESFIILSNFIQNENFTYSNFKNKVPNFNINRGDGLLYSKRVSGLNYGGYTSIKIDIIFRKDTINYLKASLDENETELILKLANKYSKIQKIIGSLWKVRIIQNSDGSFSKKLYSIYKNNTALEKNYRRIDKLLGKKKKYTITDTETKKAYKTLMHPTNSYFYAYAISPTKYVPDGRKAIELLVKSKRFDLITNILMGYNPDGRAYAIEAMILNNRHHTAEASHIISKLIKIPIITQTIVGCLLEPMLYKELIEKIEKHKANKKN